MTHTFPSQYFFHCIIWKQITHSHHYLYHEHNLLKVYQTTCNLSTIAKGALTIQQLFLNEPANYTPKKWVHCQFFLKALPNRTRSDRAGRSHYWLPRSWTGGRSMQSDPEYLNWPCRAIRTVFFINLFLITQKVTCD